MNSTAIVIIGLIVIVVFAVLILIRTVQGLPSAEALATQTATILSTVVPYPKMMPNRKSLRDYLNPDSPLGPLHDSEYALCNFYVMTANMAGIFTPVNGAAVTSTAIQYALQAGVRGLIFDIWADDKQNPILKVGRGDDSIHNLSYYTLDLLSALQMVAKEAFENSANPANNDPLFLVFRFRGTTPSAELFNNTANILSEALEKHRLPLVFSNADSSNTLVQQPITEYFGKMIVLSHTIAPDVITRDPQTNKQITKTNRFNEYMNNPMFPTTPIGPISSPGEIHALNSSNIRTIQTKTAQDNILVCAPKPEDTANSDTNSWDWKEAHAAGIQLVAVNLWSKDDKLNAYLNPKVFGTYSWLIKPEPIRYKVERVPLPIPVRNPGYKDGNVVVR